MTATNTDTSIIYVFLATTILGGLVSVGTAVYFSLRCMRARGEVAGATGPEAEPTSLQEVVVISPAVGVPPGLVTEVQHQPLLAAQRPLLQPLQLA